ncbi:GerAB/ArcD/ProY family transporter [Paenibacillus riograndensis]|uniref:Spore germination protein n=2 Tax=Paenibacillus riograndensis TaxID=483937 RepID=A0A0E4CWH2_9BACL|nr:GerAB/ArcD/ProY family transporter [Paenibacillus riograndensis]CQR55282.1 Spore germination protein [Paenibacillus riograndensis SBR5]
MNKIQTLTLFVLLHLTSIFAFFPERIIAATSKGHWMAITFLFAVELGILWVYLKALSLAPGKTVIDICREAMGTWITRLIMLPFMAFLIIELVMLTYYQAVEIKVVLLQRTPVAAISALFVMLCMYGAWKGLVVMVRASLGWIFLFMPFILFSMFISIRNFRFDYIFPLWDADLSFLFRSDFYVGTVIFAGFLFLGMTATKTKIGFGKAAAAVGIVYLFAIASVYIPLLIFGQETVLHLQYPMLMASDTIDLEWVVFDWLPSFYVVSSSGLGVIKVSVLLWMLVAILQRLFAPVVNRRWILSVVSILLYLACLWIPNSGTLNSYLYVNSYFCLYTTIGFPVIVYFAARQRRKKVGG